MENIELGRLPLGHLDPDRCAPIEFNEDSLGKELRQLVKDITYYKVLLVKELKEAWIDVDYKGYDG